MAEITISKFTFSGDTQLMPKRALLRFCEMFFFSRQTISQGFDMAGSFINGADDHYALTEPRLTGACEMTAESLNFKVIDTSQPDSPAIITCSLSNADLGADLYAAYATARAPSYTHQIRYAAALEHDMAINALNKLAEAGLRFTDEECALETLGQLIDYRYDLLHAKPATAAAAHSVLAFG